MSDGAASMRVEPKEQTERPIAANRDTNGAVVAQASIHGISEELLQALPVALYTTDANGLVTSYNEAAARLWGRRPDLGQEEYCGSYKLFWPDGTPLPLDQCPMAMTLQERKPIHGLEAVCERPDGTRIALVPYPTPVFDTSGNLIGAVNMVVDISERKRTEETLAKHRDEQAALYQLTDRLYREETLDHAYDAALDAIVRALGCERASVLLFDDAGVMRFVAWRGLSDEYRRAVEGHSPWDRDAKDPQPICVEDVETADFPEPLKQTVKAEGIGSLAFVPITANGLLVGKFMTYYPGPHVFSNGELDLGVTIARQLGFTVERFRAEEARRQAEHASRRLVSIIETSDDAIISKDLNGIISSWNRGAERLFGYTAEEMIGRSITILIPPDRHAEEDAILDLIRRGEHVDHYETVRQRKDGSFVDISLTISPVNDAAGKVIGASKIARDISEKKQAQARQELLAREIQHRTKNLFAVVLAIVSRSFAGKHTVEDAKAAVVSRLESLGQTHVLLIDKEWQGADLAEIVRSEMSPYGGRVRVEGPSVMLTARAAQNFALALHELATNAAKYGALSKATGRVHITWAKHASNGSNNFTFRWQEQGGPPVHAPTQKGFGSAVLEQVMAEHFESSPEIQFPVTGVVYDLNGSLDALVTEERNFVGTSDAA